MIATVLSIMVLGVVALGVGAWIMWRRGAPTKRVILMLLAAVVLAANIAIWTVPGADGQSPVEMAG